MPVDALGPGGLDRSSQTTTHVFKVANSLQMCRVYAAVDSTQMVDLQAVSDGASEGHVGEAVSLDHRSPDAELTSTPREGKKPPPAKTGKGRGGRSEKVLFLELPPENRQKKKKNQPSPRERACGAGFWPGTRPPHLCPPRRDLRPRPCAASCPPCGGGKTGGG